MCVCVYDKEIYWVSFHEEKYDVKEVRNNAEERAFIFITHDDSAGQNLNLLTPNDPYRGHTAPLTSKVAFHIFIQQI